MSDEREKLSREEVDEAFDFGDKTLNKYEEEALLPKGEYDLEIVKFSREVKVLTEENMSESDRKRGALVGERIPYIQTKYVHAKDKNGKMEEKFRGRRWDKLYWDLRREETRDELSKLYRCLGYDGAYVPKFLEAEFVNAEKKGRVGRFYIGEFTDSDTRSKKNSDPRPVVPNAKDKKQRTADAAAGEVEL